MSESAHGYRVRILLSNNLWVYGTLERMYAGEGQTDGLLHVRLDGGSTLSNIYERHIIMLEKVGALDDME